MTDFTIYLVINLKKNRNIEELKMLIKEGAYNCNCISEYFNHETEGINCEIKKNNIIYAVEFDNINNLYNYIEYIKSLNVIEIESIYNYNEIIFGSKNYIKSLNTSIIDPEKIKEKINKNKILPQYKKLYKLL
tara:strand:- start:181 stop:579 length:399 start_codon:yes stop_codon:yes gene_type:complete